MNKIAVITFLCFCFSVTVSYGQDTGKIAVTGSAEMKVEPDEIYMIFNLREYRNRSGDKISIEEIRRSFLDDCKKSGIGNEDIYLHQVGGGTYNNWQWRKKKKDPEFMAVVSYEIKFSGSSAIDALFSELDNEGVSHAYINRMDHSNMKEFKKEVKINALKAAKGKATYLAESLGQSIGKVLLIEEIEQGYAVPNVRMSNMAVSAGMESGGEPSTPFRNITVRQVVRAEFELK